MNKLLFIIGIIGLLILSGCTHSSGDSCLVLKAEEICTERGEIVHISFRGIQENPETVSCQIKHQEFYLNKSQIRECDGGLVNDS